MMHFTYSTLPKCLIKVQHVTEYYSQGNRVQDNSRMASNRKLTELLKEWIVRKTQSNLRKVH